MKQSKQIFFESVSPRVRLYDCVIKPSIVVVVATIVKKFIFLQKFRWPWLSLPFFSLIINPMDRVEIFVHANVRKPSLLSELILYLQNKTCYLWMPLLSNFISSCKIVIAVVASIILAQPAILVIIFYKFIVEFPFTTSKTKLGI